MADIVIFGAGQLADVAKAYIDQFSEDRVVGFTVDADFLDQPQRHGLPVVAWETLEAAFPPDQVLLLGPLSYQRLNRFRRDRHLEAKARGYGFASFVHPSAHNLAQAVGDNCFVLENCVLQPYSVLGDGVMIWSGTHVGHHSVIGDFCFLSSLVGLASSVTIEPGCMIGGQVGVDNGVTIGAESYLQSRAMIRSNVPPGSVVRHLSDSPERYGSERLISRNFV
ncbi:MAG: acetyltransferase [Thalassovita sp.]